MLSKHIIQIFRQQPHVVAVLLFGSQVTNKIKSSSDVDIAVLFATEQVPCALKLLQLQEQLSEALQCEVDLVCLNRADPIIGAQIYQQHQLLLINDETQLQKYFMRMLVDYMEVKELRRPMEEAILQRKYYD